MPKKGFNPFYSLLVVIGIVFAMTACAYGVMTVRKLRDPQQKDPHPLIETLDEHGFALLMAELGALAALSVAAMGTDSYWIRRAQRSGPAAPAEQDDTADSPGENP